MKEVGDKCQIQNNPRKAEEPQRALLSQTEGENHPFCSRKYKWAVSVHPSKNIITQQRQPAKYTLHLWTSLLRGGESKNVPPEEEKYHLADVFTMAHGHLPFGSPHHTFSYTSLDLADDAWHWPGISERPLHFWAHLPPRPLWWL